MLLWPGSGAARMYVVAIIFCNHVHSFCFHAKICHSFMYAHTAVVVAAFSLPFCTVPIYIWNVFIEKFSHCCHLCFFLFEFYPFLFHLLAWNVERANVSVLQLTVSGSFCVDFYCMCMCVCVNMKFAAKYCKHIFSSRKLQVGKFYWVNNVLVCVCSVHDEPTYLRLSDVLVSRG